MQAAGSCRARAVTAQPWLQALNLHRALDAAQRSHTPPTRPPHTPTASHTAHDTTTTLTTTPLPLARAWLRCW